MDIRSSLEGLKQLLGTPAAAPASMQQPKSGAAGAAAGGSGLGADRATVSSAGNEVSQTAGDSTVRMDKVANIQAALAAGTYNVPASAVASKVVDSMLGGQG
jgi:negative regulator of flagellin synthesis FlgM